MNIDMNIDMNSEYTKVLHVSIGTIDRWNCMKYRDQIEEILGPDYYVIFTDKFTSVSHPTASVRKIDINDDRNMSMEDLIKRITKLKEEGML